MTSLQREIDTLIERFIRDEGKFNFSKDLKNILEENYKKNNSCIEIKLDFHQSLHDVGALTFDIEINDLSYLNAYSLLIIAGFHAKNIVINGSTPLFRTL